MVGFKEFLNGNNFVIRRFYWKFERGGGTYINIFQISNINEILGKFH